MIKQTEPGRCNLCPKFALCYGANDLVPQNGTARLHEYYDVFFPCPNRDACEGEVPKLPMGKCADGYEGFLCS